jgi:hypothetical protein
MCVYVALVPGTTFLLEAHPSKSHVHELLHPVRAIHPPMKNADFLIYFPRGKLDATGECADMTDTGCHPRWVGLFPHTSHIGASGTSGLRVPLARLSDLPHYSYEVFSGNAILR